MDDHETILDHKLCGYLCTVLTAPSRSIASGLCHLSTDTTDNNDVCFRCENGVVFSSIRDVDGISNAASSMKKGRKKIGVVNGSISVVNQVHALVSHKCVKIHARVLRVEESANEARAVVLVRLSVHCLGI